MRAGARKVIILIFIFIFISILLYGIEVKWIKAVIWMKFKYFCDLYEDCVVKVLQTWQTFYLLFIKSD